jgi:hypothetical protein
LLLALVSTPFLQPSISHYVLAWCQLGILFLAVKSIVVANADGRQLERLGPAWLLGFVFLWPGMRLEPFFEAAGRRRQAVNFEIRARSRRGALAMLYGGLANLAAGAALLLALRWEPLARHTYPALAVGIAGVALVSVYATFDLLTAMWRALGVEVSKQWLSLLATRSLAEYWSLRWNRAFHDFARERVYLPLRRRWGSGAALVGSFLFSGVLHDAMVSVPARGGYGMPTLYFAIQGAGIWFERRWLRRSKFRRAWAAVVVFAPLGLLLHGPFLERVVLPQFAALGLLVPK